MNMEDITKNSDGFDIRSGTDSLMHEEAGDQELFVSEYTYSDEDTHYDRRRALERHSSTDVKDIPIVKIIESQAAQSENETNKPIVSYVQSFFRAGSGGSTGNMSWLSGSNAKRDQKRLNLENIMNLTEPGDVIDVLNRAVETKNVGYTQSALDLMTNLCERDKSKSMSVNLGTDGACSIVDHILGLSVSSSILTEAALRAICSLITPIAPNQETTTTLTAAGAGICATAGSGVSNNRRRFSSAGSVYQIIRAATTHATDEIVLEWGLRVLFYLSLEQGLVQRIISCGGCDLISLALRSHPTCDDIIIWACRTLCNCILTLDAVNVQDRTLCQDKLAQQQVPQVLIGVFAERIGNLRKLAAQWALNGIGCLSRRHDGNMHLFVELGVCELLHSVKQQFSFDDEKVAESICWVIGNVSYPVEEAQARWGACGACEVVLTALRKHVNNEETVQEALRALRNLCYDNQANLEQLRSLEVAVIIMSVMRRHQESSGVVLQWLWYAIAGLAEYRPLVLQLGDEDVSQAAVTSITKFSARADLVQWTALAIANLASELKLSVALGAANCCDVLVHVLNEHRRDEDVAEEILSAIANLCSNSIENRQHFHLAGAEASILKALAKHEKSEAVAEAGLSAVACLVQAGVDASASSPASEGSVSVHSHLAEDSRLVTDTLASAVLEKIVRALVREDGCKIISKTIHRHAAVYRIAEMGSKALSDIGLYGFNDDQRRYSNALMGSTLPVNPLRSLSVETVVNRSPLSSSTKAEDSILVPLGQSGAPTALTAVLQNYMTDVAIVQWALLSLEHIASCTRNLPILHAAGTDSLLILVLQAHFVHNPTVVNICLRLFAHFSHSDECRETIGRESGGKVLLVSMAHNMSDTLPAKLGADAVSALCLTPQFDAIAVIASKDSLGPSYDELNVNQHSAMKALGAEVPRPRSRTNSGDDTAQTTSSSQSVAKSFGSLFGWQTSASTAKSEKTPTLFNKGITTFELMSKKGAGVIATSRGGVLMEYAQEALGVSKGMTDQEEELHTARALAKSKKSNSSVLIKNGVTTILLTILDKHCRSFEVQIAAVNAINSLALDNMHRNDLNHEGIFESIIKAYKNCLRVKNPVTTSKVDSTADLDESFQSVGCDRNGSALEGGSAATIGTSNESNNNSGVKDATKHHHNRVTSGVNGLNADEQGGYDNDNGNSGNKDDVDDNDDGNGDVLVEDEVSEMSRRVLLVTLNITVGTLCLPLTEELEGITANTDNGFASTNQNVLGKLGACELLVQCMKRHARDALVCEAVLRGIYYLARCNEANQLKLGSAGAVGLIVAAMRMFFFKPHIVYYCCQCIAGLSFNNVVNADQFDEAEVADWLYKVLNMYMEHGEVVEAACHAIYALKDLNHRMSDLCKLVVNALISHADSVTVCQYACQAIGTLSELHSNKVLLDKHDVCSALTSALQKYVAPNSMLSAVFMREDASNAAVAQWGCTAIYYMARGANSHEYQVKLVNGGACELVTKALLKYSEFETISHACFRSLVVLLMNNAHYKSKLGALGVCSCVVESMHMFPYSAQVAKWGCRAVAVLAESHEANIARLGVAGACESIPVILQAHPGSEHVACAGCDVISFMSEVVSNGFAARFGRAGGCEAVVTVLRTHAMNAHVVTRASIAVASLSRVKGNATWMGPAGACDALITVMQAHHTDLAVSKFIISAMGNLCIIDNNRERLGTLGACELIVSSARIHMQDLDTAKAATLAMGKLCEHIYRAGDSEDPLAHIVGGGTAVNFNSSVAISSPASLSEHGNGNSVGDSTLDLISVKHIIKTPTRGISSPSIDSEKEQSFQSISDPPAAAVSAGVTAQKPFPTIGGQSNQQTMSPITASPVNGSSGRSSPLPSTAARPVLPQISAVAQAHANAGRRNRGRLFDAEYCSVLSSLLASHITDAHAINIMSRTISIVAYGDACIAEREALAAVGTCKALAKAIQYHEGNESIGRGVCWAVKALTHNHHRNKEEFRAYGICAPTLVVLRGFRYSKNATQTVQGAAAAIANLCQDNLGNKAAMGKAGACEGLLEVMELHYRNIEMAYLTAKALFHVCDGNHENRLKISFSGAADILMNMATRYADEERILDYVYCVMIGMCLGKVGQSRLGTVGVGKVVVSAMYRYEKSSEYLILLCCALINGLAANSNENQIKLGSAGACKAIASIAIRYARSTTFNMVNMKMLQNDLSPSPSTGAANTDHDREVNLQLPHSVEVVAAGGGADSADQSPTDVLAGGDATEVLESKYPLSTILGELSVLKECCKAVVHLCAGNESNRQKFIPTPLLDTLTTLLPTAIPYGMTAAGTVTGNISAETLRWMRNAVDVLMGKV